MISIVSEALSKIIRDYDVTVLQIESSSSDPDVAIPIEKLVIINTGLNTHYSMEFRLAHELSHIIYGDSESQKVYAFSPLSKKEEENVANYQAIRMLARIAYQDTPMEYRNYIDFMDIFGLPLHFENVVKRAVSSI